MAALKLKEDATTGLLTLYAPLMPRLGGLAFGLIWLAAAGFFVVPSLLGGQGDFGSLIFFLVFAGLPSLSSLLGALMDTTVVVDRGSRTITITKRLLALPYSTQPLNFADVTTIELQPVRTKSQTLWLLNVIGRGGKRWVLNWNGTQSEINDHAQKISTLVGVPVASAVVKMPVAFEQMLGKIAPNAKALIEQAQSNEPASSSQDTPLSDSYLPPSNDTSPTIDTLSIDQMPTIDETSSTEAVPATDLKSLTMQSLEQRIANDAMDSDARYVLARKYHARGQVDKAMALYQDTMRLDPTNTNAQNDLGVAWQQRGKRAEAEAAYRRAIALDPFSSIAHLNLGLLLRALNRAADASQEFYQARQNARGKDDAQLAEAASTGAKIEPQLSKT